ncbi:hypothetical protein [Dyella tabacisoli]|uniref:hypothetical protein n=1 Tax=Dyella tabacisoli TaxID=2282381 RepID=UPI0013B46ADF|nr:hypothetical protein [Dyella tabacisoli]
MNRSAFNTNAIWISRPKKLPFDPLTTEGLFIALYFLSERVESVAMGLLERQEKQAR